MLASQVVNKVPLPQINSDNVLRVPHDSLLKVNYGLKTDLVVRTLAKISDYGFFFVLICLFLSYRIPEETLSRQIL